MTTLASPVGRRQARELTLSRLRGPNNEGFVILAIILLAVVVGFFDTGFWSLATLFNVLHDSYENMLFALGFLLILLTGGIDVSFDAIGIFAGYSVALMASNGSFGGGIAMGFAIAAGLGLVMGAVNAAVVTTLRLPVLIVTLGTRGLFTGILLTFVGSNYINSLPGGLGQFANMNLLRVHAVGNQTAGLQVLIIPIAVLCVLAALWLKYTMLGRGLYALGGGEETARRNGFPINRIKVVAFLLAGILAALAGMVHISLIGYGDPQDLVGQELNVIAAVVLGGASIFGGRGSVGGTVLGVLLISLINYSLILLGIPSAWVEVAVGGLILVGVSLQLVGRRSGRVRLAGGQP